MKIFISYKSQNRDFANLLWDTLHTWGHETWMDVHNIPPGAASWSDEIQKGLNWADITLGVMTEIALNSENVKNEWNWTITYRQKYGKRLILLRVEDCDVPMHYISSNWIDVASMGQMAGLNLLQNWLSNPNKNIADSTSIAPDPYQTYLETLYDELAEELDFLVLSVERMMDIRGHSTPEQVEGQRRMLRSFSMRRTNEETETPITSFEEGFKKYKGRLLLLGEPGAGKTITLLTTARDTVLKRLQDPTAPLPLIGRIATWDASKQTPLHEWLAEYTTLSADIIRREMDAGKCLLLLDGLDELGSVRTEKDESDNETTYEPRLRFIEQVNRLEAKNHILITSRIADYEQIGAKLTLNGSVTLDTLTNDQIQDYLSATEATTQLWDALQAQPDLLDVARTPLLLSLLAFTFRDLPEQIRSLKDLSKVELRDAIFEQYIAKRYQHELEQHELRNEKPPFSLEEICEILGQFAMNEFGGVNQWHDMPLTGQILPHVMEMLNSLMEDTDPSLEIEEIKYSFTGFSFANEYIEHRKIPNFISFCIELNFIISDSSHNTRFIHLLMRDYFLQRFCIPKLRNSSWYSKMGGYFATAPNPARAIAVTINQETKNILLDIVIDETTSADIRGYIIDGVSFGLVYADDYKSQLLTEILIAPLTSDNSFVRQQAIQEIIFHVDKIPKETLYEIIRSSSIDVSSYLLGNLGTYHTGFNTAKDVELAVEILENLAKKDPLVDTVIYRLNQIGTPEALDAVRKWREENNMH